jgi:CRISPR/Cas system endoribonuclease Cas6 (RAMP superfamily)
MKRKLEEIDEILASYEDWMHGINGEQCTKARKLLSEVQKQLKNCNFESLNSTLLEIQLEDIKDSNVLASSHIEERIKVLAKNQQKILNAIKLSCNCS